MRKRNWNKKSKWNSRNSKNNLNNIVGRINNLNKSINEESQYKCSQINDFCPFIKEINKQTFQN